MNDATNLTPAQITDLKRQLKAANDRLLAVERRREELQAYIATLTGKLERAEIARILRKPA